MSCLFSLALFAFTASAFADDTSGGIESVRVGFNGTYKVGYWTPVEVRLGALDAIKGGEPATLEIVVPDGDGVPSRVSSPIIQAKHEHASLRMFVKFGRVDSWMVVQIRQSGVVVAQRRLETNQDSSEFRPALPATSRLVLSVGKPLLSSQRQAKRNALSGVRIVELEDTEQLPERWIGYTGIDALVVTSSWLADRDVAQSITAQQATAIDRWVRSGGRLVLSVGKDGSKVLAPDSPWAALAPGRLQQVVDLPVGGAFESFVGAAHRLESRAGQGGRLMIPVARFVDVHGDVAVAADGVPLIIDARHSLGSVVLVAVDLAAGPFPAWPGQSELLARLLGSAAADQQHSSKAKSQAAYEDLSGQLRQALDQFEGVAVFTRFAGMIFGLIAIYGVVVGPLDYFLVGRFLGRGRLTWITFPLMIVIACGAAYVMIGSIKGRASKLNQIDVVDIDAASGVVRGTSWAHAYSPASGEVRYDFRFSVPSNLPSSETFTSDAEVIGSWMGLPGSGLGGMDPVIADTNQVSTPYDFAEQLDAMFRVPIPASSSKSVIARWRATSPQLVESQLRAGTQGGLFQNSTLTWNARIDLPDAMLFHDRWVFRLGDLKPGDTIELNADRRDSAVSRLRRHRIVDGEEIASRFDVENLEVPYIVETMMFHAATGGASYTAGLEQRYMSIVDMSQLMHTDVAILVGQPKDAILKIDFTPAGKQGTDPPDERHWSFLRVVLPVEVVQR